jgi:hypothetical protein
MEENGTHESVSNRNPISRSAPVVMALDKTAPSPDHSLSRPTPRSGSRPNRNSLAGAAPAPSLCHPVKAKESPFVTDLISEGTDASTACSTSPASPNNETSRKPASTSTAKSVRAKPDEKHAAPTNDTSPTGSSDAYGKTKNYASTSRIKLPLDKGASDRPRLSSRVPFGSQSRVRTQRSLSQALLLAQSKRYRPPETHSNP